MSELLQLAEQVVGQAQALGAEEVSAYASQGSHVSLVRREGKVEQATEATTRGLMVEILSDGRYTSNSTSDLRPEAIEAFLKRCVESSQYLEPDPDRALPPGELCGRGISQEALDQDDPTWYSRTLEDRNQESEALEAAFDALRTDEVISAAAHLSDGQSEVARVMSNGFADSSRGVWFSRGMETTLREGSRRPEAYAFYTARHHADLPPIEQVAKETLRRAHERLGSGPIDSGRYPMILANHAVGRILGILGGPLSGAALHEGRSCLAGKLGEAIGSPLLSLIDDPTLPRGLGSRAWDGDAIAARPRTIIEEGVLRQYYIDVYYGRRLGMEPTTGGRSNWVLPVGDTPWQELAKAWPRAILVTSFLGGNSNQVTGDFSLGIRGMLVENGEVTRSLGEMNVGGNIIELMQRLIALGDDPWTWSPVRSPTLIFDDVSFSGTRLEAT